MSVPWRFHVPEHTDRKARALAARRGETLGDVVAAAVAVLDYLAGELDDGAKVLIDHPDRSRIRELIVPGFPPARSGEAPSGVGAS